MKAILAPVPCLHIFDALKTCAKHGTVAFGSQADFFFQDEHKKCRFPTGTKVLITATRPELAHSNFYKFGTANFRAAFVQWTKANDAGENPSPQLRPLSTIRDTPFFGFWEVSGLEEVIHPIPFQKLFAANSGQSVQTVPRGPIEVIWNDAN